MTTLFKMPKFLALLFFVEMWERFSYYGMRGILVLFLIKKLGLSDPHAYAIYSLFAAFAYAGPVFGGFLADRLMGFRYMVVVGASILVLGHCLMFLEIFDQSFVYLGLGFIATGTGLFKGNITNLLGTFYKTNDPERDRGFTLFYVAVNLGSVMATVSCAFVAELCGWNYGFGLAAIGMILGLIMYISLQNKILGKNGLPPKLELLEKNIMFGLKPPVFVVAGGIAIAVMCAFMLRSSELFSQLLAVAGVVVFLVAGKIIYSCTQVERRNMIALIILMIFFMFFFALEMQLGSLINLFTDRNVVKSIFGYTIPTAVSQAINPFSILMVGPILAPLFVTMGIKWEVRRVGIGLVLMLLAFLTFYVGCNFANEMSQVPYIFLFVGISLMGVGELFIAPVVHALFTALTPLRVRGFMMGVLMLSLSFSNLAGVVIAKFMSVELDGSQNFDALVSLSIYKSGFFDIMMFNIYLLGVFIILYTFLNRIILARNSMEDDLFMIPANSMKGNEG